jgi:hypothetical protein
VTSSFILTLFDSVIEIFRAKILEKKAYLPAC